MVFGVLFSPVSPLSPHTSLAATPFLHPSPSIAVSAISCSTNKHRRSTSFRCSVHSPTARTSFPTPEDAEKWDSDDYQIFLKGGDQVISVLQEMLKLLEDMEMDEDSEKAAVEVVAQGVVGKRVDEMETGFMMALDYMISVADKDGDDQRKSLLEVIKQTVLDHLTKKCPPHVQVIGLLCRTPLKESRHELLRRVAAGGGVFKGKDDTKVHLPGANLDDIAKQADDLLETMEARPTIPDRKLLARLVLIREEARNMMGGGLLDERNSRGLSTLPEAEVNFLSKLVALKPGKPVQEMISKVMHGKDEGADKLSGEDEDSREGRQTLGGVAGRGSVSGLKPRPVRPGMFLETVSKVLGGIYSGNVSGITAQHLEWVHQKTLQILQDMAF
ncbi:hypothetical protein J5N97_007310 [Dioscorea zingiberensis]|uniref:Protein PEP-RELATED DEVELOPMENT ARRESTED 1, chloroplastic n=1 Tax=Dioscorea zingiberensis TaxID=325984 RepID=A0A9D5HU41_9LILI|nr:hypothetical protein J5N97_007310 [Dioscorea zingiberensis]